MGKKSKILFVSIKDSARSQIAAGILRHLAPDDFEVSSAGISPSLELNPFAVMVMNEIGIDISKETPKSLLHFLPHTGIFDYIITVCSKKEDKKCPAFSAGIKKIHWDIKNPEVRCSSYEKGLEIMRKVRDDIYKKVEEFVKSVRL